MIAIDLVTTALIAGVTLLVVTTSLMATQFLPARRRPAPTPTVRRALPDAKARASIARGELPPAKVIRVEPDVTLLAAGQIERIRHGLEQGRPMSPDDAGLLARFFAETDPEVVAEVITQWIREDMANDPDAAR
jgi:hypothetical protein